LKPLTHRPLKRGEVSIGDWIPAADQSTVAGCADFLARQQARMKLAQSPKMLTHAVIQIQRKQP
jgi:hypothetical protein